MNAVFFDGQGFDAYLDAMTGVEGLGEHFDPSHKRGKPLKQKGLWDDGPLGYLRGAGRELWGTGKGLYDLYDIGQHPGSQKAVEFAAGVRRLRKPSVSRAIGCATARTGGSPTKGGRRWAPSRGSGTGTRTSATTC